MHAVGVGGVSSKMRIPGQDESPGTGVLSSTVIELDNLVVLDPTSWSP